MPTQLFKYTFHVSLSMTDVEGAFVLAIFATEMPVMSQSYYSSEPMTDQLKATAGHR